MNSKKATSENVIRDFFKQKSIRLITESLTSNVLTSKYTGSGNRKINLWTHDGLIDDDRNSEKEYRKFNIIEMLWINIISTLREYGFLKEKIKKIKDRLHNNIEGLDIAYPNFTYHIIQSIFYGKPRYLVVDHEGHASFMSYEMYDFLLRSEEIESHILISLNHLFNSVIARINKKSSFDKFFDLSQKEMELLAFVQQGNFKQIKIIMKDGEIYRLEGVEKVDNEKRIIDILREGKYQNIEVRQEGGKIVYIDRTVKKKLK